MAKDIKEHLKSMSLGDHLEELRARMILAILGLLVGMAVCLFFGKILIGVMSQPFEKEIGHLQKFFKRSLKLELPVNAIILSTEQFKMLHPLNTARQNLFYEMAKTYYPDISVYGYRTACWEANSEVRTDAKTVRWYSPHKAIQTELRFNKYHAMFPEAKRWAVWVSFGWGYDPQWQKLDIDPLHWVYLGRRFAADDRIEAALTFVGFGGSDRVPLDDWHDAFVLFVQGATAGG